MTRGLTSDEGIRKLRNAINQGTGAIIGSWRKLLFYTFRHHFPTTCCWILLLVSFLVSLAFVCSSLFPVDSTNHERISISGIILLLVLCGTIIFNIYFVYLRTTELRRKVGVIVSRLDEVIAGNISVLETPDLYEPASESVTLQWTYRDGNLVNLPWIILVTGDVILLRPGREIPCKCRPVDNDPGSEFEAGQIYLPQEVHRRMDGIGVDSFVPLPCLVVETPAITYIQDCLSAKERPRSLTENEFGRILHFYIERIALPVVFGASFISAIFIYVYDRDSNRGWYETLIITPISIIAPLTMPLLSLNVWSFIVIHTAQFLAKFSRSVVQMVQEREKIEPDLFTDANTSESSVRVTGKGRRIRFGMRVALCWSRFRQVARLAWKLFKGDPTFLPFSANIVQTLGNVTSLSIVDKKGIMSWANPTPEKVFFFSRARRKKGQHGFTSPQKRRHSSTLSLENTPHATLEQNDPRQTEIAGDSSPKTKHLAVEPQGSPAAAIKKAKPQQRTCHAHTEVLDLSHDPYRSFVVHFDDSNWRSFSNNLKPLGLNILLNSCNLHKEYVQFIDHVHAVSTVVPRTVAVVNRRCLCYLAKAIGFDHCACSKQFEQRQTLAAYRKTPGDLPVPGLTKHRSPLPNLFSVIVRDKITGHCQLLCQGTADLVTDACNFYWDGVDVKPLERQHKKKINDFSQRHSMTAYCVAFSYRPLDVDVDNWLNDVYIDWPTQSARQRQYDSMDCLSTLDDLRPWRKAISFDSLLSDEYFEVHKIDTPLDVLNHLLKRQVFLGMISLQYQAKPDVVRLVDRLDKACIRFVHYSRENELRSRIFAEKCGLEAGWNCHISLGKESEAISAAGSHLGSQVLARLATVPTVAVPRSRTSLKMPSSDPSRRRSLPDDFKIDLPAVHFKSATATPINESIPRVVCVLTRENELEETEEEMEVPLAREDRSASVATISGDSIFDDPSDQISVLRLERERTPLLSDTTSRTSLGTNHSLTQQPIVLPPNRARLPKGIENVRPHLENVDNVPLLVPLFTDCYPTATVSMVSIMQEYGEVVCIMGSSLNYRNAQTFTQGNASIGIEPLRPAVCMSGMDSYHSRLHDRRIVSSTDLATLISTLPCSVCLFSGQHINLLDLIAESRHHLMVLRTFLLYYVAASMTTSAAQLLAQLFTLHRPMTTDLLVWLICVIIPLISGSLCWSPKSNGVLKTATPKNSNWVSKKAVKKFLVGFALRFLPSAIFALLLFQCSLIVTCVDQRQFGLLSQCNGSRLDERSAVTATDSNDSTGNQASIGLVISRHLFTFTFVLCLCTISSGFVHYRALYKDHAPWRNVVWILVILLSILAQFLYALLSLFSTLPEGVSVRGVIPWKLCLCALLWPAVSLPLNELLKSYELERLIMQTLVRKRVCYLGYRLQSTSSGKGSLNEAEKRRQLLDKIIRVDHAGELGADRIYAGQMYMLGKSEAGPLIQHMWDQEKDHLSTFERLIPQYRVRPTVLLPMWNVVGFALGLTTAAMGKEAAMACTEAVEEVIGEHYNHQMRELMADDMEEHKELLNTIRKIRDDELDHHDTAIEQNSEKAPMYSTLKRVIQFGCRRAIWLSERI